MGRVGDSPFSLEKCHSNLFGLDLQRKPLQNTAERKAKQSFESAIKY